MEIPASFASNQASAKMFVAGCLLKGHRIGVTFKSPFVPSIKKRIDGTNVPPPPNVHYQFSVFQKQEKNQKTCVVETVSKVLCVFHLATASDPLNFKGCELDILEFCQKMIQTHHFFGGSYELLERKIFPKEWCPGLVSEEREKELLIELHESLPELIKFAASDEVKNILTPPETAPRGGPRVNGRARKISKPQARRQIAANARPAGDVFVGTLDL